MKKQKLTLTPELAQEIAQGAARYVRARFARHDRLAWGDLIQEALVALYSAKGTLTRAESITGMGHTIATRAIRRAIERDVRGARLPRPEKVTTSTPEDVVHARRMIALAQKKPVWKHPLVWEVLTGSSPASVANRERVPIGRLNNAVWMLREKLREDPQLGRWK